MRVLWGNHHRPGNMRLLYYVNDYVIMHGHIYLNFTLCIVLCFTGALIFCNLLATFPILVAGITFCAAM